MEIIIFCGIQASGKTTFYKEHFFKTHMRISLDQLHTRNKEQVFINACFSVQQRFVVDNTNPTKAERAKYITAAKSHKYKVIGYYFKTNNKLEPPVFSEGFDELYSVEIINDGFEIVE
jgi:predicted kinase